jgi:hypothetical protein
LKVETLEKRQKITLWCGPTFAHIGEPCNYWIWMSEKQAPINGGSLVFINPKITTGQHAYTNTDTPLKVSTQKLLALVFI